MVPDVPGDESCMTYISFHLLFNAPVILLLIFLPGGTELPHRDWTTMLVVCGIVMVFTTPWDNYAARCGIWSFPKGRYWKKILYLPVEEYAFFILQSVLVMLLCRRLSPVLGGLGGLGEAPGEALAWSDPRFVWPAIAFLLVWIVVGLLLRKRIHASHPAHYAWHLFFWFTPVAVFQWLLAGPILAPQLPLILTVTALAGAYYSLADLVAIRQGIWDFDSAQISGILLARAMPWEEVAFFFLTSLIVAQSYLMILPALAHS